MCIRDSYSAGRIISAGSVVRRSDGADVLHVTRPCDRQVADYVGRHIGHGESCCNWSYSNDGKYVGWWHAGRCRQHLTIWPGIPVSYTHLDVYKRQVKERTKADAQAIKAREDAERKAAEEQGEFRKLYEKAQQQIAETEAKLQAAEIASIKRDAVSYTHLDVYKRQVQ